MTSPQEPKFDPNAALREFNAYFGSLRKDYGEDAIRGAGFTPRDLSLLQASLRKLQMDPNATPEQHRQAYQQARDALAQRITTPLAAARPTPSAPPEVEVRGVRPPDVVNAPMPEMSVRPVEAPMPEMSVRPVEAPRPEMAVREVMPAPAIGNGAFRPTVAQLNAYHASGSKDYWNTDTGAFEPLEVARPTPPTPPPPMREYVDPKPPMPVPSASDYIASTVTPPRPIDPSMMSPTMLGNTPPRPVAPPPMTQPDVMPPVAFPMPPVALPGGTGSNAIVASPHSAPPVALPGGSGYDERGNMLKSQPKSTLDDMIQGVRGSMLPPMQATPMQPTAPGILSGITQQQPAAPSMNTQPGADFDRNVARQIFDAEFRTLREKYGDDGLRAAGLTPRTLASLQAPLTNVQKDNTISYDQSSAALENALQQLRGYNFGGAQPAAAPAAPMQPAAPAPLPAGAQQSPIPGYYRGGFAQRYR